VTKAGQGESNDEDGNEVMAWSKARECVDEATAPRAAKEHNEQGKRVRLGDRLGRAVVNRVRAHTDTRKAETRHDETRAKRGQQAWCSVRLQCASTSETQAFPIHCNAVRARQGSGDKTRVENGDTANKSEASRWVHESTGLWLPARCSAECRGHLLVLGHV